MIGVVALGVVALFAAVFGTIAAMQQVQDRRRERDEIAEVVRELRQHHRLNQQRLVEAQQHYGGEDVFEQAEAYRRGPTIATSPEWRGRPGFEERRERPLAPSDRRRAA